MQAFRRLATAAAFASMVACLGACKKQADERLAVIEFVLRSEAKEWMKSFTIDEYPCVKLGVLGSIDSRNQKVTMTIPLSSIRAPFTPCVAGKSESDFQFYEPEIAGDVAYISADFRCGGMCGKGETLFLERTGSGWKVGGRMTRWIS